jgi:hypothetical protein
MRCCRYSETHCTVYMDESKYQEVTELAHEMGISVSGFVRMCLNEKLKSIQDERRNMQPFRIRPTHNF